MVFHGTLAYAKICGDVLARIASEDPFPWSDTPDRSIQRASAREKVWARSALPTWPKKCSLGLGNQTIERSAKYLQMPAVLAAIALVLCLGMLEISWLEFESGGTARCLRIRATWRRKYEDR
jgi:hypothetical protein